MTVETVVLWCTYITPHSFPGIPTAQVSGPSHVSPAQPGLELDAQPQDIQERKKHVLTSCPVSEISLF